MEPAVFLLVALSSVFHVAWNALLKTAGDPLRTAAVGLSFAALVLLPVVGVAWWLGGAPAIPGEALGLAVASGGLEALYFVLLSNAYRRGDLSVVYPVARGSATLFAIAAGTLILGETLTPVGWLGVTALVVGLVSLRPPWAALRSLGRRVRGSPTSPPDAPPLTPAPIPSEDRPPAAELARTAEPTTAPDRTTAPEPATATEPPSAPEPGPPHAPAPSSSGLAVALAIATGLVIASYSAVDRQGARLVEPWLYAGLLWATMCLALGLVLGAARLSPAVAALTVNRDAPRPDIARAALGGLLTLGAYSMVLFAFRIAPLTAVAPLRESAVVLASGWGAIGLREAAGRRAAVLRIGAAGLIVLGAVLLALDG